MSAAQGSPGAGAARARSQTHTVAARTSAVTRRPGTHSVSGAQFPHFTSVCSLGGAGAGLEREGSTLLATVTPPVPFPLLPVASASLARVTSSQGRQDPGPADAPGKRTSETQRRVWAPPEAAGILSGLSTSVGSRWAQTPEAGGQPAGGTRGQVRLQRPDLSPGSRASVGHHRSR